MAVAQSSSGGVTIHYVLRVCFHVIDSMACDVHAYNWSGQWFHQDMRSIEH